MRMVPLAAILLAGTETVFRKGLAPTGAFPPAPSFSPVQIQFEFSRLKTVELGDLALEMLKVDNVVAKPIILLVASYAV